MRRGILLGLCGMVALAAASFSAASPSPPALEQGLVTKVATGVARVEARSCRGRWVRSGTGFLVGRRVVMTARHVLDGACSYTVVVGGRSYRGSRPLFWYTAGLRDEESADVATLALNGPVRGHVLAFARRTPEPSTTISALAYAVGGPLRLSQGPLLAGTRIQGVPYLEIGIATARGASGAAFLDPDGNVVGILQRSIVPPTRGRAYGVDLVRWWGSDLVGDLCGAYPRGGIRGCSRAPAPS